MTAPAGGPSECPLYPLERPMRGHTLLLAVVLAYLPTTVATAAGSSHLKELHVAPAPCQAPCIGYTTSNELQNDWTFAASPSRLASNNLYPTLESDLVLAPLDRLQVLGDFIFEPVKDATPGHDHAFNDLGAFVDQLFLQAQTHGLNLQAGKIHPAFGRAWDVTPGLHSTDIPGEYELEERIGAGAAYGFKSFGLETLVQASAFTVDRTVLSESAFTNRHRTHLSDGGAGNTSGVSSLAIQLDGCLGAPAIDCYGDGDFGYELGARYQQAGRGGAGEVLGPDASSNKSHGFDGRNM